MLLIYIHVVLCVNCSYILNFIVVFVLFKLLTSAVGGWTAEGLQYMFAANYVGHFLLTMLLLGKYTNCSTLCLFCKVQLLVTNYQLLIKCCNCNSLLFLFSEIQVRTSAVLIRQH